MYAISGKIYIFSSCVISTITTVFWLLELWCFTLQTCHTLLLLVFQDFNRLRNFSCWSLNEVIYCDHSKVLLYDTLVLLHFIAASLADGCTQKSFFAITAEVWTRIWNYIWNRACVFCYCTQVCHLCYCLSMSTLSVVQLFLLRCVLPNLTTIKQCMQNNIFLWCILIRCFILCRPLFMVACNCFDLFQITFQPLVITKINNIQS